ASRRRRRRIQHPPDNRQTPRRDGAGPRPFHPAATAAHEGTLRATQPPPIGRNGTRAPSLRRDLELQTEARDAAVKPRELAPRGFGFVKSFQCFPPLLADSRRTIQRAPRPRVSIIRT